MKKIPSFEVDHLKLLRGIYVSRKDQVGNEIVTTFDLRMKRPNLEPVMSTGAIHTIEHLGATFLRNKPDYKNQIIYFGPMGCRTGIYVIVKGDLESKDIIQMIQDMFLFMANYQGEVPGVTSKDCGHAQDHNLEEAQLESKKYYEEVLSCLKPENLVYPE